MHDIPLLFMKVGTPGAEPIGFYEDLATLYGADRVSTDDIRLDLGNGRLHLNARMNRMVRERADEQVGTALFEGFHVVYDGFLNAKQRRLEVIERVVEPVGAASVMLVIDTDWAIIERRLLERHDKGELGIPSHLVHDMDNFLDDMYDMRRFAEWPETDERRLSLDGALDTATLLAAVGAYVTAQHDIVPIDDQQGILKDDE